MSISTLYVHESVKELPRVRAVASALGLSPETIHDIHQAYARVLKDPDPVERGKQVLVLTKNKGAFLRPCPGTRKYRCCGYRILHVGTYCTMDCSYCILQAYFHPPVLQFFVNLQDLLAELKGAFSSSTIQRIGTGEFTDSLIWDPWTGLSRILIPAFADQSSCVLELKTKTADVSALMGLAHREKTLVAWSLNTPRVIETEETGTAALPARLKAAEACQEQGYPLAFHFDPMVIYEGCEEEYAAVLQQLFESVAPESIVWISLGALRFPPELKHVMDKRHPRSRLPYGELIRGKDGKMRYFKPLRIRLYRKMAAWIREAAPGTALYLCMEDDEVWEKALGWVPPRQGVKRLLDDAAMKRCGLGKGKK